jgi:hemerythrin
MTLLTWNPAWETGIPQIDQQHRELLDQFGALLAAIHENNPWERIPGLLSFLSDYVDAHFSTEEDHMRATRYPGYVGHKAIHDDMRAQVERLAARYQEDRSSVDDAVLVFLTDWLIDHIQVHDRQMAQHLHRFIDQTPRVAP